MKEYPCNPIMYYTTRPILKALGIEPLYWKNVYIPAIPFIPLIILWVAFGIIVIIVFGGIAMILRKDDVLWRVWFQ